MSKILKTGLKASSLLAAALLFGAMSEEENPPLKNSHHWAAASEKCALHTERSDRCASICCPARCNSSTYGCAWNYETRRCENR